jgi:hypothetical protein
MPNKCGTKRGCGNYSCRLAWYKNKSYVYRHSELELGHSSGINTYHFCECETIKVLSIIVDFKLEAFP